MIKRNSITFKFFVITTIFFILFTTVTMILQSAFFEKFYITYKVNLLQKNVKKFQVEFLRTKGDKTLLLKNIMKFQEENNAILVIADSLGNLNYLRSINKQAPESTTMMAMVEITDQWINNPEAFLSTKTTGKIYTDIVKNADYNVSNIICINPVVAGDKIWYTIFATSSLQPIGEASVVIREMYFYFYIFAVVIISMLSLIYSNMITKPLINLNKTVAKMAQLDFSVRCDINSKDEIGSLSNNFNFLCEKLDLTLEKLKTANLKLMEDIEVERSLEKMRKEFIAGVSHELKTPISLIAGYAEGLKDEIVEGEKKKYYLEVIIEEADKMAKLIEDMLDLSQLESGSFNLNTGVFYIEELILIVLAKHSEFMKNKNLKFKVEALGTIRTIGDKFRIEQVITNFLTNAIRHTTDKKDINIIVKDNDRNIRVSVENQGEHIEEAQLEKIWDKFYRIDKSRSRIYGGTGLGLAICRNILLLHESEFGAENTLEGVLFYFTLKKA